MRSRPCLVAAALLALHAFGAPAQTPSSTSAIGVQVTVVVDSAGVASVVERYRLPPTTSPLQLQLLQRDCASVSSVTLSRDANARVLGSSVKGPWVIFRDTTTVAHLNGADTSGYDIRYTVSLGARSVDIPLVHLAHFVPRLEDEREGSVSLSVVTDGEARFPRLSRAGPGQPWVGRFVAIPSFVRLERLSSASTAAAECAVSSSADASDGGLTWRFWTFLAIMAAWVPLYLAWARRAQEGEA